MTDEKKNYDAIVKLIEKGDYDTIFATKVEGNLRDESITVWTQSKAGIVKKTEYLKGTVESIEKIVSDIVSDNESELPL